MRRTTLGPISSSQLNARQGGGAPSRMSLAPSVTKPFMGASHLPMRQSMGPAMPSALRTARGPARTSTANGGGASMLPPPHARNSLVRQSIGRRSTANSLSLGAGAGGASSSSSSGTTTRRTDPRPLSDKAFMNGCIQNVLEYLSSHQYPHPLSPKMLRGPSKKEFVSILHFLFRQLDPNFEFESGLNGNLNGIGARNATIKIEDEIVNKFRTLGYSVVISKTALVAVGSPHSWPALLGALTWLVEFLRYEERVQAESESMPPNSTMEFFEYVQHSYNAFLAYDEDRVHRHEQQMLEHKNAAKQEAVEAVNESKSRNQELRKLIEEAKNAKSSLPALHSRKNDCLSDLEKFSAYCKNLEAHQQRRIKNAEKADEELRHKQTLVVEQTKEIERLQLRIEQQDLSAEAVERIQLECRRVREELESVTNAHKTLEGTLWAKDSGILQLAQKLEAIVNQYGVLAGRLKLTPATAKYANGMNLEIQIDAVQGGPVEAKRFSEFVHKTLAPALVDLRQSRGQRKVTALNESDKLADSILVQSEQLRREQELVRDKENQLRKLQETLAREQELVERTIRQRSDEIEETELQIQSMYSTLDLESQLRQSELAKQTTQAKFVQMQERYDDLIKTNRHLFTDALTSFTQHKASIESTLAEVETFLHDARTVI